jgi:hypothetical protein
MFRASASRAGFAPADDTVELDREGRRGLEPIRRLSQAEHGCAPTQEGDRVTAEREFVQAIEAYKISSGRMFPTWSEVLEVLVHLGYVKLEDCPEQVSCQ